MTYKQKFTAYLSIVAALAVTYVLTVIFSPERRGSRSAEYSWLESGQNDKITGITIANPGETTVLARNGGKWFVSRNGKDYPARDSRVEDFISSLAKRAPYPVRSSGASAHERLSLTEDKATRITVSAGAGLPLLSLLVGQPDVTGQGIYLRKQGENEVRSGEDLFSAYIKSSYMSWYNLRLFPETENGKLSAANVQRLTVYPPKGEDGAETPPMVFTRENKKWAFNFELANPDTDRVDSYIRDILFTTGDDFDDHITPSDSLFNNSRIVLELGDGSIKTLRLAPPDETGRRFAAVSGSDWVYIIAGWAGDRLFASPEDFEAD